MKPIRTKQCKKCPWKVSTNPHAIPDGYSCDLHKGLHSTIAQPGDLSHNKAMACHHSPVGKEDYCIGWLHNQLGVGNNIALRMRMMSCYNINEMKVYGEQHQRFIDTLPKEK